MLGLSSFPLTWRKVRYLREEQWILNDPRLVGSQIIRCEVVMKSATKIALSCVTKIACVNKPSQKLTPVGWLVLQTEEKKLYLWKKKKKLKKGELSKESQVFWVRNHSTVHSLSKAHLHTSGDFCRATWCNFCPALSCIEFQTRSKLRRYRGDKIAGGLHARFWSCNSERDKNCIELPEKRARKKRAPRAKHEAEGTEKHLPFYAGVQIRSRVFFWFHWSWKNTKKYKAANWLRNHITR